MNATAQPAATGQHIDLTKQTEVLFWCRVFDVSMDQLREAIHRAGHTSDAVERYLRQKAGKH